MPEFVFLLLLFEVWVDCECKTIYQNELQLNLHGLPVQLSFLLETKMAIERA